MVFRPYALFCAVLTAVSAVHLADPQLERSDPVWSFNLNDKSSVPALWIEAPFCGNGMVGAYATVTSNGTVELELRTSMSPDDAVEVLCRCPTTPEVASAILDVYTAFPQAPTASAQAATPF